MTIRANREVNVTELSHSKQTEPEAAAYDDPYDHDPCYAYLEWLDSEHRLLSHELFPESKMRFTPCNTFARDFHWSEDWRSKPKPSTRAEAVMRFVGVRFPDDGSASRDEMPTAVDPRHTPANDN